MTEKRKNDLDKLWLPAFLLFSIGAWQAEYAMIFPLKAKIAGLAGITISLAGFLIRYNQLSNNLQKEKSLWITGSRLVFTGISFYTLHPVAITLTILMLFIIKMKDFPDYATQSPAKYESTGWLMAATLFYIMDLIHDFTVRDSLIIPFTSTIIYSLTVIIILYILFSERSSKSR